MNNSFLKVEESSQLNTVHSVTGNSDSDKFESTGATIVDADLFIKHLFQSDPNRAFESLFKFHYKPLCNLAVRYVYSKEIAEDLVSDVFYDFLKKERFESISGSFRTYLFQAVRYKVYRYLKNEFGDNGCKKSIEMKDFDMLVDERNPQQMLMFDELIIKIRESVNALPPQCLNVFLLSRFEGKKNKEISEKLGIKLKTVESHMMKALSLLRNRLENYLV